ncbi:fumarylacetoacetate hydrolase family protein [Arcobacter arenosus]|jgi:2-keto-4-pentenoate hydratase/2-oxohepta-3-ene-1,7-dioic acid hydratase in catechol pathway|uniref:Fumarylacetoacetate hydrolase family protein n=1 Tax=Arcobacter arenosus TaxID=2576037 RepID=A0A5R8XYT8_9BACT|nr:fumarylacetoacetate hydrolase family protein [Arcobacter arenosus]TLP36893.1 fumarylacetoacetate hydrolase family protein [Arcobacter arenosus]
MNYIILKNNERIYPSKVVCIGRNYTEHIKELNNETPEEMVFFFKPNSSVSRVLTFPQGNSSCHYEAEISFLMEENKITAVGFGLDLTLREVQSSLKEKGLPWERAKCFNGSAVFSQFVSFNGNIEDLELELYINGEIKQKGDVSLMINKPKEIIDEVLTFSSFEDGDILMTGTPKGVGNFVEGDIFEGKIFEKGKLLVEQRFLVN